VIGVWSLIASWIASLPVALHRPHPKTRLRYHHLPHSSMVMPRALIFLAVSPSPSLTDHWTTHLNRTSWRASWSRTRSHRPSRS
jgi:hypothetical protein